MNGQGTNGQGMNDPQPQSFQVTSRGKNIVGPSSRGPMFLNSPCTAHSMLAVTNRPSWKAAWPKIGCCLGAVRFFTGANWCLNLTGPHGYWRQVRLRVCNNQSSSW